MPSLKEYSRKRNFARTAEPKPRVARKHRTALRFVIQKHDASRLHYDFRLELDGTLKSWAVPKGIPLKKGEKHLAVQVEDHPLDYAGFEGIIPKGEYGAGTVMVWDTGTYEPLSDNPAADLNAGRCHIVLHGNKLEGSWSLVRIRSDEGNQWLLIKASEDAAPISKRRDDQSAVSGRTMKQIAKAPEQSWKSNLEAKKQSIRSSPRRHGDKAEFVQPMRAKLVLSPPKGSAWTYELKFDGYRAIAVKNGRDIALYSRNAKRFESRYKEVAKDVATLSYDSLVLDGEIVALDSQGRSSFQLLQNFETSGAAVPVIYYVFDVLHQNGEDLRSKPFDSRRQILTKILHGAPETIRLSAALGPDPAALLKEVRRRGLEGIIGKRSDSRYEPGLRTGAWIKIKCVNEQEFVIGGFTPPEGSRSHFGAILVGYHENGRLRFAGKVGTGFSESRLAELAKEFAKLRIDQCPFADLPERKAGKWNQNITPSLMRKMKWVKPVMVCQVRFTEWTNDGKLRHPSFIGLREDKTAGEVTRERKQ